MELEKIRQHTAGTILQFSLPAIIAMVLTSLITVVDGFFIGNYIGGEGIAAVNLGQPIIYLFLSIGLMVSVGGAAIAGMLFGARDMAACNQVFRQTIVTTTVFSVLTAFLTALFFEPMLDFLGAVGQVRAYFRTYYGILLLELVVMVVNSSFGMFIRGEGACADLVFFLEKSERVSFREMFFFMAGAQKDTAQWKLGVHRGDVNGDCHVCL